ncbi:MAG: hypothetical protein ABL958_02800 [Bdellovibrionia bacterium]
MLHKSVCLFVGLLLSFGAARVRSDPAAHFVMNNAVVIGDLNPLPKTLIDQVKDRKVVIVGEIHGTTEISAFTAGLVRGLAEVSERVLVAIEWPKANQKPVENFLKSGNIKEIPALPIFAADARDGRTSTAMVDLLIKLRTIRNAGVLCFDVDGKAKSDQQRDSDMAKFIRSQIDRLKPSITVVLTGNVHAKSKVGADKFKPFAYQLSAQKGSRVKPSDILTIGVRNHLGAAWFCQKSECAAHHLAPVESVYSTATAVEKYFLLEPEGEYGATLFIKKLSASAPYIVIAEATSK